MTRASNPTGKGRRALGEVEVGVRRGQQHKGRRHQRERLLEGRGQRRAVLPAPHYVSARQRCWQPERVRGKADLVLRNDPLAVAVVAAVGARGIRSARRHFCGAGNTTQGRVYWRRPGKYNTTIDDDWFKNSIRRESGGAS